MGRNLFIRVSAVTYDEKMVRRAWPSLYSVVWPDVDAPGGVGSLASEPQRGVLDLANGFVEYVRFADMHKERRKKLSPLAERAEKQRSALDEALGDRDVHKASLLTLAIEETLDEAEQFLHGEL